MEPRQSRNLWILNTSPTRDALQLRGQCAVLRPRSCPSDHWSNHNSEKILNAMLREEINRAFLSRSFLFAVALGLLSLAPGLADYMSGPPRDPEYLARLPPFYNNAYDAVIWAQSSLIGLIGPLIAVLPFADSFAHDRVLGYLRFVLSRTTYRRYLSGKYVASFLSGGLAVSLPMLLCFMFSVLILPRGLNLNPFEARVQPSEALGPFGALYNSTPDLYILSLIALSFLFGATYAIFGLSLSALTDNRYIVLATPFVLYNVAHYGLSVLGIPAWSPLSTLVPHWLTNVTWLHVITNLGGVFLISTVLYFVMAHKVKSRI